MACMRQWRSDEGSAATLLDLQVDAAIDPEPACILKPATRRRCDKTWGSSIS